MYFFKGECVVIERLASLILQDSGWTAVATPISVIRTPNPKLLKGSCYVFPSTSILEINQERLYKRENQMIAITEKNYK